MLWSTWGSYLKGLPEWSASAALACYQAESSQVRNASIAKRYHTVVDLIASVCAPSCTIDKARAPRPYVMRPNKPAQEPGPTDSASLILPKGLATWVSKSPI
ncbi:hypothetical protein M8818_005123 [Zalaria obscura]|uniref:Uncharacterized protein n=1 Tax=Zalaria obscura TaxID=2024903 RepID=A0ACC3SAR6_9PEZI